MKSRIILLAVGLLFVAAGCVQGKVSRQQSEVQRANFAAERAMQH